MRRAGWWPPSVAVCTAVAFTGKGAHAADPPPEDHEAEVVVAGEPTDQSGASTTLTQRDLVLEASGRLENAVTDVPGATQFRRSDARSAHPTSQGLTLRGLGGNAASRVLVLYDGVPQSDPFGGWIPWPTYDVLPLGAAKLERGGGSGVYGPGALGGTLELVTDEPRSLGLDGAILGGSRDTVSWRLSAGLPAAFVTSVLGVRHESSAGFVPTAEGQRGPV